MSDVMTGMMLEVKSVKEKEFLSSALSRIEMDHSECFGFAFSIENGIEVIGIYGCEHPEIKDLVYDVMHEFHGKFPGDRIHGTIQGEPIMDSLE